jgi:MinD-like ATPase involved in chromosome partitioning or flagellar assembly
MSNRGALRGPGQPKPARPARPADANPTAATVPEPVRVRPAPAPLRRQVPPGGTALDGLDDLDSPFSAGSSWRDLIRRVTGIDLGPSKGSAHEDDLRCRIRTGVGGAFPVAVLNFKGGVGKTSVVEALGSTFADVRDDRVIAVDIDAGDLAERHGRRNPLSMADLLADNSITQYSQVRAHTYMNSFGLEVLGLPDYGRTDWRLGRSGVVKAFSVLRKHYSVILVDCVKAINSSVMDAVLPEARALVVVTGASIDAVRKTRTTLDWLGNNGYRRLLGSTVLAVNNVGPDKPDRVVTKELEALAARVVATVQLPFDRHVREGKEIGLDRLSKGSRRGYLELAAALADMVPGRS